MIVAKIEGTNVKLYESSNGAYLRTVSFGVPVKTAQVEGNDLAVGLPGGIIKIYDAKTGAYRRTI